MMTMKMMTVTTMTMRRMEVGEKRDHDDDDDDNDDLPVHRVFVIVIRWPIFGLATRKLPNATVKRDDSSIPLRNFSCSMSCSSSSKSSWRWIGILSVVSCCVCAVVHPCVRTGCTHPCDRLHLLFSLLNSYATTREMPSFLRFLPIILPESFFSLNIFLSNLLRREKKT